MGILLGVQARDSCALSKGQSSSQSTPYFQFWWTMVYHLLLLARWQHPVLHSLVISQCSGGHFYGKLRHHLCICSILPRGRAESFKGTKGTKIQSWHLQFENPKFWPRTECLLQAHAKENFSVLTRKLSKKQIAKNQRKNQFIQTQHFKYK